MSSYLEMPTLGVYPNDRNIEFFLSTKHAIRTVVPPITKLALLWHHSLHEKYFTSHGPKLWTAFELVIYDHVCNVLIFGNGHLIGVYPNVPSNEFFFFSRHVTRAVVPTITKLAMQWHQPLHAMVPRSETASQLHILSWFSCVQSSPRNCFVYLTQPSVRRHDRQSEFSTWVQTQNRKVHSMFRMKVVTWCDFPLLWLNLKYPGPLVC